MTAPAPTADADPRQPVPCGPMEEILMRKTNPVLVALIVTAVSLLVASAALGSSGTTDGDPGVGQQIANVTMPLAVLALLAAAVVGIVTAVRRRSVR
jgi:hypothetical protein